MIIALLVLAGWFTIASDAAWCKSGPPSALASCKAPGQAAVLPDPGRIQASHETAQSAPVGLRVPPQVRHPNGCLNPAGCSIYGSRYD